MNRIFFEDLSSTAIKIKAYNMIKKGNWIALKSNNKILREKLSFASSKSSSHLEHHSESGVGKNKNNKQENSLAEHREPERKKLQTKLRHGSNFSLLRGNTKISYKERNEEVEILLCKDQQFVSYCEARIGSSQWITTNADMIDRLLSKWLVQKIILKI